jgi:imidazolonepropionase-like amidohydrolase
MKRVLLCVLLLTVVACLGQSSTSSTLIIHDVTIIDATGAPAKPHQTVIVRDGQIEALDSSIGGFGQKLPGTHVDGTGKFLIPGLWDMHVHMVFGDWFPHGKEVTLPLFIANGITGVRDMGGELEVLQQWRKGISAGTLIGPRIVMSGPMLDGPKPRFPSSIAIKTPVDGGRLSTI